MTGYETCIECRFRMPRDRLVPKYPGYSGRFAVPHICLNCARRKLSSIYELVQRRR